METLERVRLALETNPAAIILVIPDEEHRELLQAAIEKQNKNATAAKGTISALTKRDDPLLSRIIEGLTSLAQLVINVRPPSAQLDGTPMGEALRGIKDTGNGTRGGEPETVGQVAARTVANADASASRRGRGRGKQAEEITWSDEVPLPRPRAGDKSVTPSGVETAIKSAISYDPERNAFRVMDVDDWDGLVVPAVEYGEVVPGVWHLVSFLLDYPFRDATAPKGDETSTAANTIEGQAADKNTGDVGVNAEQFDAALAEAGLRDDGTGLIVPAGETDTESGDTVDPEDIPDGASDDLWDDEEEEDPGQIREDSLNDHETNSAADLDTEARRPAVSGSRKHTSKQASKSASKQASKSAAKKSGVRRRRR